MRVLEIQAEGLKRRNPKPRAPRRTLKARGILAWRYSGLHSVQAKGAASELGRLGTAVDIHEGLRLLEAKNPRPNPDRALGRGAIKGDAPDTVRLGAATAGARCQSQVAHDRVAREVDATVNASADDPEVGASSALTTEVRRRAASRGHHGWVAGVPRTVQ